MLNAVTPGKLGSEREPGGTAASAWELLENTSFLYLITSLTVNTFMFNMSSSTAVPKLFHFLCSNYLKNITVETK